MPPRGNRVRTSNRTPASSSWTWVLGVYEGWEQHRWSCLRIKRIPWGVKQLAPLVWQGRVGKNDKQPPWLGASSYCQTVHSRPLLVWLLPSLFAITYTSFSSNTYAFA